ncbi:MAG TPA: hypothetical protein DEQ30_04960 [Porphyromonadaceae bacterium]|nr:hypothetical protein [Porphyromonadaceae bacterium]
MSKIICNSVDYVFSEGIMVITPESVTLKPGYSWKNLPVKEKSTYSSAINQADAGPIREESVTAVTKFDADPFLKKHTAFGIVLRMKTDDKTFYVGSDCYPCLTEVSGNRINDTYTFNATSTI